MRTLFKMALAVLFLGSALPASAQTEALQPPVPAKRFALSPELDLPGGDLATILDTSVEACMRACLANDRCTAFTFNARNNSCFPKSGPGEPLFYAGALSGVVLPTDPAVLAAAEQRRAELAFLGDADIAQARLQAETLSIGHPTGQQTVAELQQAALDAEAAGAVSDAARYLAAALTVTDEPGTWIDYSRLLLAAGVPDGADQRMWREAALTASVNAYLRAADPALRHTALVAMGAALESLDRGRDTVQALRLAQALQARDDTALALDQAIARYGFRITETTVESDSARPRICATFSEDLVARGVDYATYVQLPEPGLTVAPGGWRQLCVEGVRHGARYAVTFREGLPAADGQSLARSTTITQYVRDRSPSARFPGRTYVLPRAAGASIPVESVNTETLELTLYEVSDRNMLRAVQDGYFSQPMQPWSEEAFAGNVGAEVWRGTASVAMEVNRDVLTRLPMDEAIAGLTPAFMRCAPLLPGPTPTSSRPPGSGS